MEILNFINSVVLLGPGDRDNMFIRVSLGSYGSDQDEKILILRYDLLFRGGRNVNYFLFRGDAFA